MSGTNVVVLRNGELVVELGAADDLAVLGDGERLQPAGADVEPDRDAHAAGAPSAA